MWLPATVSRRASSRRRAASAFTANTTEPAATRPAAVSTRIAAPSGRIAPTGLPSYSSTPASSAARRRARTSRAGCTVARSLKRAFRYVDALRVGNVVVNDSTDYWEAHEPFGGAAGTKSGWGRIGGRYTMLDMTDLKTVVLDFGSSTG